MRILLLFAFSFFLPLFAFCEELTLHGRVVDAETGEPLPYVNIRVGNGIGTLTNIEGSFKLLTEEKDVLSFSFVGYERLSLKADQMPDVIRLKPYTVKMKEVTVLPLDKEDILKRVIENLRSDYKTGSKWTRKYFFRALMEQDSVSYIAEVFMEAFSVMNVRSAQIISGLQGYDKESGKKPMSIHGSNIHQLIEVAPRTSNSSFWKPLIKPFSHYETLKGFYKVKMQTLYDAEGQALLRFDFTWRKNLLPMDYNRRNITGTAYVDAETCRLLRIAIQGSNDFMSYRVLLFAIEENKQEGTVIKASKENIVTALQEAGYDASLWDEYDIIKRTKEEEAAAFGK